MLSRILVRPDFLLFLGMCFFVFRSIEERKWFRSFLLLLISTVVLGYHQSFADYVSNLGSDSLFETTGFNNGEAIFWFKTFFQLMRLNWNKVFLLIPYLMVSFLIYFGLKKAFLAVDWAKKKANMLSSCVAILVIVLSGYGILSFPILGYLSNSRLRQTLISNFAQNIPEVKTDGYPVNLFVYVGESTSTMNMGLYGYPRDTSPELRSLKQSDPNLLVFENVLSTHTHTVPSLLEALSFAVDESENFLPIYERKRVSVLNLFSKGGVHTILFSNQGASGALDLTSSLILRCNTNTFSTDSRFTGNTGYRYAKPFDDQFFVPHVSNFLAQTQLQKNFIILHSYAGHGSYLDNIPERFRQPVDKYFDKRRNGTNDSVVNFVDNYDSAMRYVDHSVSEIIHMLKKWNQAAILVYFSDHGDSAYAMRGHDSSRFIHEMARIPFILYFNETAKRDKPQLFAKYQQLALDHQIATLGQLSSTLMDLIGVQIVNNNKTPCFETPVIGENARHWPIVIRETAGGILSYVQADKQPISLPPFLGRTLVDRTDDATKIFLETRSWSQSCREISNSLCNNLETCLRAAIVGNCLKIDAILGPSGEISISDDDKNSIGLEWGDLTSLPNITKIAIWIDAHRLEQLEDIKSLVNILGPVKGIAKSVMIELAPDFSERNANNYSFIRDMRSSGFKTRCHIPVSLSRPPNILQGVVGAFSMGNFSHARTHKELTP